HGVPPAAPGPPRPAPGRAAGRAPRPQSPLSPRPRRPLRRDPGRRGAGPAHEPRPRVGRRPRHPRPVSRDRVGRGVRARAHPPGRALAGRRREDVPSRARDPMNPLFVVPLLAYTLAATLWPAQVDGHRRAATLLLWEAVFVIIALVAGTYFARLAKPSLDGLW